MPMTLIQRAYRFAIEPNAAQRAVFDSHAGGARVAYNFGIAAIAAALDARKAQIDAGLEPTITTPDHFTLCKMWTAHKDAYAQTPDERGRTYQWVGDNFVGTYQAKLRDAYGAWRKFFDSRSGKRKGRPVGRPRFASKHRSQPSFQMHGETLRMADQSRARTKGWAIVLPKVGAVVVPREVRVGGHVERRNSRIARSLARATRPTRRTNIVCPRCNGSGGIEKPARPERVLKDGTIKPGKPAKVVPCDICDGGKSAPAGRMIRATISRGASGTWWCSVTAEVVVEQRTGPTARQLKAGIVGLDLGTRWLAVDSDATLYPNPQHLNAALAELRMAQRALARCEKESKRREKARRRVGQIHERVAILRKDSANRLTTALVRAFSGVAVEGWDVQRLASSGSLDVPTRLRKRRNQQLADAAPGMLRWQLEYKTSWNGTTYFKADPAQETGRTCSRCWTVKTKPINIDQDMFACDACGLSLDRRINTARMVKGLAEGHRPKPGPAPAGPTKPRGGGVRPGAARRSGQPPMKRAARAKSSQEDGHT